MAEKGRSAPEQIEPRFKTLNQYVDWVSKDWVKEFGSDEAQLHVRAKLREEADEVNKALQSGDRENLASELGDLLWTANAAVMNEGFTLPEKSILLEDIDKDALESDITWDVPVLQALYGLTDKDITAKIKAGDVDITQKVISSLTGQLGKAARMTRVLSPEVRALPSGEHTFSYGWLKVQHGRVIDSVRQINLLISYVAQTRLNLTLADIAEINYRKLSGRIELGQPVTKE